jgi:membrane-associated phospholipid phosphatase
MMKPSNSWMKILLIILNLFFILFIEVFSWKFRQFAVESAIYLQSLGNSLVSPQILWGISEILGPDPRVLTFIAILLFAQTGEQMRKLLFLKFSSQYLRWFLGILLQEPRPSWYDDRIEMLHCPITFGLPSGHAILSVTVVASLAFSENVGKIPKVLFFVWFISMCIGRIYLGTHSPHDLLLGITLGITFLFVIDASIVDFLTGKIRNHQILIFGFLFIGVVNSFLWAMFLNSRLDRTVIDVYEENVAKNHCTPLSLISPREGTLALTTFFGVLLAISQSRMEMSSIKQRCLVLLLYGVNKSVLDVPSSSWSMFILTAAIYASCHFWLFGNEKEISPAIYSKISFTRNDPLQYGAVAVPPV